MTFTDDPLQASATIVRKSHLDELRSAAQALRGAAGLPIYTFAEAIVAQQTIIKAEHLNEIRAAMEAALRMLDLPIPPYAQPSLTPGVTAVAQPDIQELRNVVK